MCVGPELVIWSERALERPTRISSTQRTRLANESGIVWRSRLPKEVKSAADGRSMAAATPARSQRSRSRPSRKTDSDAQRQLRALNHWHKRVRRDDREGRPRVHAVAEHEGEAARSEEQVDERALLLPEEDEDERQGRPLGKRVRSGALQATSRLLVRETLTRIDAQ